MLVEGPCCRRAKEGSREGKDPCRSFLKRTFAARLVGTSRLSTYFQHMMPNYRSFEIHRFAGEQDALESTSAVGKIENAIPAQERPFAEVQGKGRQKLIRDWWHDSRSASPSLGADRPRCLLNETSSQIAVPRNA